ncbi:MAG: HK97 family phage prohead protease [Mesorhizobium sp.]|nr:MAG: HK97 family phage prohead protease [Mesorhizobium sp.]
MERFQKGSLDKSIRENGDSVVACWAHDTSRPLARVSNGSLQIKTDNIGLWYALTPNPESPMGQEAIASVESGLVDQVSISFYSEAEEWDDTGDLPQRLVTQAGLVELSLVIFGAYGKATTAALTRSDTAMGNAAAAMRRVREKAEAAHRLRGIV